MSKQLTKKQIVEYKTLFKLFDKNNNGFISPSEFKYMLKQYHINMTDEEIDKEIVKFDKNRDSKIDFEEFINILVSIDQPSK